jgi:MFS family permease
VNETPVFKQLAAKKRKVPRLPIVEAIRSNPRHFFIVVFAQMGQNGLNYTFLVFGLNYMTSQLRIARNQALLALVMANLVSIATILLSSALSDRIGRRPVYISAAIFTAAMTFPFFWLLTTRNLALIYLAYIVVSGIGYGAMFGPQAAFYAELFDTRLRYSGFAFARELGTILGGGPAPLVSAALAAWLGGRPWGVATYVTVLGFITAAAVYFAPEMYRSDLSDTETEKPVALEMNASLHRSE